MASKEHLLHRACLCRFGRAALKHLFFKRGKSGFHVLRMGKEEPREFCAIVHGKIGTLTGRCHQVCRIPEERHSGYARPPVLDGQGKDRTTYRIDVTACDELLQGVRDAR